MHLRNFGCRISDQYVFNGYRTIVMENELLRVSILADKGTDIFEFLYKPLDIDFMWRNALGFQHPANFVPTINSKGGNFMDYYHGGWQEIFPIGGGPCDFKGAEMGQHGEIALIPWEYQILIDTEEEISVRFTVRTNRTPFYLEKVLTMKANTPILYIKETVVNEGEEEINFMWGHHPAFGGRFLDETCVIDAPAGKVESFFDAQPTNRVAPGEYTNWPMIKSVDGLEKVDLSKVPPKESRSMDMCFLTELEDGWYGITNTGKKVGFGMRWDKELFPHIWYWMVFGGAYGYPAYGRYYNLALEPFSSYAPHRGGFPEILKENGHLRLGAGESITTELMAIAYAGIDGVKEIKPDGTVIGK